MNNNNSIVFSVFFTILLCFTFISPLLAIRCNPYDRKVLDEIYGAFGIMPYHLDTWDPIHDCCQWSSVTCDEITNRVINLEIFKLDNSGQISEAVGDLPYLKYLSFHHLANLTGTIPPSITKLTNLEMLDISYTNISGPIPSFLTKLKKLFLLNLSYNNFNGSIPPEFSQFKHLVQLHLDPNKLSGTIPESFGHFTGSIPEIYLSHNQLTGQIPKSLANLNVTYLFDLSRNNLTGDASFLFGKNTTIPYLDLSRNNLTFDLSNVEFSSGLTWLDLNHNKIFGSLPLQLTQLPLQLLNVSYNRLCGAIPQGGNLQNFDNTSYFHNRCLCGAPLPLCTTQLPNQIAN